MNEEEPILSLLEDTEESLSNHKEGHRVRLRKRFLASLQKEQGISIPDYEILELMLLVAKPRGDVKPMAKELLLRFGGIGEVVSATETELRTIPGMGLAAIASLKTIQVAAQRLLSEEMRKMPVVASWQSVLDYCKAIVGFERKESFVLLYLNSKNSVISHEIQQEGTVDHTPIYPREVVKRALDLSASAIIMVHNHPSGDTTPSQADIQMTQRIKQAVNAVDIHLHDHLIIAGNKHYSFAAGGLL